MEKKMTYPKKIPILKNFLPEKIFQPWSNNCPFLTHSKCNVANCKPSKNIHEDDVPKENTQDQKNDKKSFSPTENRVSRRDQIV